jgi:hypothetical protein
LTCCDGTWHYQISEKFQIFSLHIIYLCIVKLLISFQFDMLIYSNYYLLFRSSLFWIFPFCVFTHEKWSDRMVILINFIWSFAYLVLIYMYIDVWDWNWVIINICDDDGVKWWYLIVWFAFFFCFLVLVGLDVNMIRNYHFSNLSLLFLSKIQRLFLCQLHRTIKFSTPFLFYFGIWYLTFFLIVLNFNFYSHSHSDSYLNSWYRSISAIDITIQIKFNSLATIHSFIFSKTTGNH